MGLAGRKQKQRIPADPRNLSWADDASRFGLAYLSKFGWDASQGLGSTAEGTKTHIKVQQKLDMMGIGAQHQRDPNGIAWKQNKDFEALLKRLNENGDQNQHQLQKVQDEKEDKGSSTTRMQKKETHLDDDDDGGVVPKPRPMAHRARIRAAKKIADKSASAISEILGIPTTASASSSSVSTGATSPTSMSAPISLGTLTTSSKSVADYFKERLGRSSSSSGSATPAVVSQEEELPRRGIGSRMPIVSTPTPDTRSEQDPSAEKRRRKAERRAEKQRQRAEAEEATSTPVVPNTSEEKRKRKKKRERRADCPSEDEPRTSKKSKKDRS